MTKFSKRRKFVFWLILILVFTVVPITLIEGGGRLYIHLKYGVPGKSYGLWRYDKILGAQHKEYAYNTNAETNNFGFRNKENVLKPRPTDSLRIIAYGGSTTYSYNLLNEEAWPIQLQKILRMRRNTSDQVLNGGAILWSIGHAYARAKKDIPKLKPDAVIIYSGINEDTNAWMLSLQGKQMEDLISQGDYGQFATNLDQNRWIKRNLFLARAIDYTVKPFVAQMRTYIKANFSSRDSVASSTSKSQHINIEPKPAVLENYLFVLKKFLHLIIENGGKPIFVVQAQGGNSERALYLTSYSVQGSVLAEKLGAIVVDARKTVSSYGGDSMDLFYHTGVHYSKLGSEEVAYQIYNEALKDL